MYQCLPSFILGFHGCDRSVGEAILSGEKLQEFSSNSYDWLGHGLYFWENDFKRAENWSQKFKDPFVVGAVIDLGKCLNLLQSDALLRLKTSYESLILFSELLGYEIPENKPANGAEKMIRNLDCAVVEMLHAITNEQKEAPYDTVRGAFFEGDDLYPNAGFKEKNHIQICVRNQNCIKGYFLPRNKSDAAYPELKTF